MRESRKELVTKFNKDNIIRVAEELFAEKGSKRKMFLYIHKISCAVCILVLFFHIASYYIMEL